MAFSLKLKKRSGFLPLFLIRVFSLQVDLSQLILIKKQGSTHGNFIKILKFFGGFLPFFQISGVSDWALDQSHQESGKIYPIFMYTMTTINHCDNKWGAMLCVPSILVISYSFPSSRSLPCPYPWYLPQAYKVKTLKSTFLKKGSKDFFQTQDLRWSNPLSKKLFSSFIRNFLFVPGYDCR